MNGWMECLSEWAVDGDRYAVPCAFNWVLSERERKKIAGVIIRVDSPNRGSQVVFEWCNLFVVQQHQQQHQQQYPMARINSHGSTGQLRAQRKVDTSTLDWFALSPPSPPPKTSSAWPPCVPHTAAQLDHSLSLSPTHGHNGQQAHTQGETDL